MEARATIKEASVSRTFVAVILMLVAMGLGAMGGYVAKGAAAGATSSAAPQVTVVRSAQIDRSSHEDPAVALPAANTSPLGTEKNGIHGDHGNLS